MIVLSSAGCNRTAAQVSVARHCCDGGDIVMQDQCIMHACFVYHACVLCMDSSEKRFQGATAHQACCRVVEHQVWCYWCACWGSGCLNVPALFVGFFA